MNLYNKGEKIYYYLMDTLCTSKVVDFYELNGEYFYVDKLFNNLKECYIFNDRKKCIKYHENKWIK